MMNKYSDLKFFAEQLMSYEDINEFAKNFYFDTTEVINYFVDNNYIRIIDDKIVISDKLKKELDISNPVNEVSQWIEDWRNLFPKGSNKNGYPYRGDKQGCLHKMKGFVKNNPDITKEEIFKATENYVNKLNYGTMIKQAHFFVEKNKSSDLMAEIEMIRENNGKTNQEEDINWG